MHLPIRSWKKTLETLRLKRVKRDSKSRAKKSRKFSIEPLQERQLLAADLIAQEPNDTVYSADITTITPAVPYEISGTIGDTAQGANDVDMYSVSLAAGQQVTIDMATPDSTLDTYIRIFDDQGIAVQDPENSESYLENDDEEYGNSDSYLTFTAPSSGTYMIGVSSSGNDSYSATTAGSGWGGGSTGAYTMNVTTSSTDVADTVSSAQVITLTNGEGAISSVIGDTATGANDVDMYAVTLTAGQQVTINLDTPESTLDTYIRIFDNQGNVVQDPENSESYLENDDEDYGNSDSYLTFTAPSSGTYMIGVSSSGNDSYSATTAGSGWGGGSTGAYTMNVTTSSTDVEDTLIGAEVITLTNGEGAISSEIGDTATGANDVDMYAVTLTAGQQVTLDLATPDSTLDTYIRIFDDQGNAVQDPENSESYLENDDEDYGNSDSYLTFTAPSSGTYMIGVSSSGNDSYSATVSGTGMGGGSSGVYTMNVSTSSTDIADTVSGAPVITLTEGNGSVSSTIGDNPQGVNDVDMYAVTLTAGQQVTIDLNTPESMLDTYIRIFDDQGNAVQDPEDTESYLENDDEDYGNSDSYLTFTAPSSGTYMIGVSSSGNDSYSATVSGTGVGGGSSGVYTMNVTATTVAPTGFIVTDSNDNVISSGANINLGSTSLEVPTTWDFEITNDGEEDLDIGDVFVPAGYTLINSPANTTIAPSNSLVVTLRLDADSIGAQNGTLSIEYGQPSTNLFTLYLSGVVTAPGVTLSAQTSTLDESSTAPGSFTVSLPYTLSTDLTVYYSVSGTADEGNDYQAIASSVVIPAGSKSSVIEIHAIDDVTLESDETVTITLTSNSQYSLPGQKADTITLVDDDLAASTISVSVNTAVAAEGGASAQFMISLPGITSEPLTVYYTMSGDAANGIDYEDMNGVATIPAGQSSVLVNIVPIDDVTVEATKTVTLTVTEGSGYALGSNDSASVTITDNDLVDPQVTIEAAVANAYQNSGENGDEGALLGWIRVSLPGTTAVPLEVQYTVGGTATADTDYVGLTGTVTIPAGKSSAIVPIIPLASGDFATPKTVEVSLTTAGGEGYSLGTSSTATVTIHELEPQFDVVLGNNQYTSEGTAVTINGSFADTGGSSWSGTVDYGDGSAPESVTLNGDGTFSVTHTYLQDGKYDVLVTVTSNDGRSSSGVVMVTVSNVGPQIDSGTSITIGVGQTLEEVLTFDDPGSDIWTATVNYGDGSGEESLSVLSGRRLYLNHVYESPGYYSITVTLEDETGAYDSETISVMVEYPPEVDLGGQDGGYSTTFVEDGAAVSIVDYDATIYASSQVTGMTVSILNAWDGDDELLTVDTSGTSIAASYENGVLSLTGADSTANYQQVLRTLQYSNTAETPHAEDREIEVIAHSSHSNSEAALATVGIVFANDAPVATSRSKTVGKNVVSTLILGNDGDTESVQELELVVVSGPSHGIIYGFDPVAGTAIYKPEYDYTGTDSFTYRLVEPGGESSDEVTLSLTVAPYNEVPNAHSQEVTVNEDSSVTISLSGDDGETIPSQTLVYSIVTYPKHGTLSGFDPSTGNVTYTPDADYVGEDFFEFRVTDDATLGWGAQSSMPEQVTIQIQEVNDAPVSENLSIGVGEDSPVTIVLGHDGDVFAEQSLALEVLAAPSHGQLTGFNPLTGEVIYTPDSGYQGTDAFSYRLVDLDGNGLASGDATVDMEVAAAPTATAQSVSVVEDENIQITLVGDDGDSQADPILEFVITGGPAYGEVLSFDPSAGTFIYQPYDDFHGNDVIEFAVRYTTPSGNVVTSLVATLDVTVTPVNDAPISIEDEITIPVEDPFTLFLGSDGDSLVTQSLTLNVIEQPQYGTLTGFDPLTASVIYTPNPGYVGVDYFAYTLTDDNQAGDETNLTSEEATIEFNVQPLATVTGQTHTIQEDGEQAITLQGQAGSGGDLVFVITSYPEHGELVDFDPVSGTATYVPYENYNGDDSFSFVLVETHSYGDNETELVSTPAVVEFTITPVNDAPDGEGYFWGLGQDKSVDITLDGWDSDYEVEQVLTYAIVDQPTHGTISNWDSTAGTFTYTPNAGYFGIDEITFSVTDDATAGGAALTSVARSILIEVGANPVAVADTAVTDEDTPVQITLGATDGDPTNDPNYIFALASSPANGEIISFDPYTGVLTYRPYSGFAGTDSFEYTVADQTAAGGVLLVSDPVAVTITVNGVDAAPSVSDRTVEIRENSRLNFVAGDDGDREVTESLTLNVVSAPAHGTITTFDPLTGVLTYEPDEDYYGTDTFSYTLTDSTGLTSEVATVNMTISRVNAAPVVTSETFVTTANQSISFTLTGDDGDADLQQSFQFEILTDPMHGSITSFDPVTGAVTYVPGSGFEGTDKFLVSAYETLGDGSKLASHAAEIKINVNSVNTAPVAYSQELDLLENKTIQFVLTGDDADADFNQTLTYQVVTAPQHGTLTSFDPQTGEFTYEPDPNYYGTDSFEFKVTDDSSIDGTALDSSIATVSLNVQEVNIGTMASAQTVSVYEDSSITINLGGVGNPSSVQNLTYSIISGPSHGTIVSFDSATGVLVYQPTSGYTGTDTFEFSLTDEDSCDLSASSVLINVIDVNSSGASAANDSYSVRASDGTILLDVLGNDTSKTGARPTIVSVGAPTSATASLTTDSSGKQVIEFTPASSQTGLESFTYTIGDGNGGTSTATVYVDILADGTYGQMASSRLAALDSIHKRTRNSCCRLAETMRQAVNLWFLYDGTG